MNQTTLILKTEGMAAYGLQTFDIHRRVNHFPTRSAVLGLLGAASGITRAQHERLFQLSNALTIAVQVNKAGTKITDYHTVTHFRSPAGKVQAGTKPTYRDYWCDTEYSFAVGGPEDTINQLADSVKQPVFGLFQGRKSCPLLRPLYDQLVPEANPATALQQRGQTGQIFSDVSADHQVALLQVRDLTTAVPRKYAMRTVYVCGQPGVTA